MIFVINQLNFAAERIYNKQIACKSVH